MIVRPSLLPAGPERIPAYGRTIRVGSASGWRCLGVPRVTSKSDYGRETPQSHDDELSSLPVVARPALFRHVVIATARVGDRRAFVIAKLGIVALDLDTAEGSAAVATGVDS